MLRPRKPSLQEPQSETPVEFNQVESWLESRLSGRNALWKDRASDKQLWRYYCPFCGVSRSLKTSPQPRWNHVAQIVLTTLVATVALWPWFGVRGVFFVFPLWAVFEVLYRIRVRAELRCEQCGFDPTLYLADAQLARREMELFWKNKLEKVSPNNQVAPSESQSQKETNPSLTAENAQS